MRLVSQAVLCAAFCTFVAACGPPHDGAADGAEATTAETDTAATPAPAAAAVDDVSPRPWIDFQGTSTLGFGILRLVPPADGPATFTIHYADTPGGYAMSDSAQLFVVPGDAFATVEAAYADDFLAFTRTSPSAADGGGGYGGGGYGGKLRLTADVTVAHETTVIVGYGPWTGPDVGRPSGDEHTFDLRITSSTAGAGHEWIESEAGELVTTNWTLRPGVERGGPLTDPVSGDPLWLEVRPLILYDARFARATDEPVAPPPGDGPAPADLDAEAARHRAAGDAIRAKDAAERAADLRADLARRDLRIVLTPALMERFRRVPIRWR